MTHVLHQKSMVFFIDGPGGTGKTYLYKALLAKVRSMGRIAIATATSGIAASIMPGGRTEDDVLPFKFKRKQFPIRLSFAMTINKARVKPSQMLASIFLSRCSLMANSMWLCLEGYQHKQLEYLQSQIRILTHGKSTKNIVYRDVLV
ncbi:unnamed protein product [Triticum turgidum subsp. durum]|uniref:ATP-dependent DNA helicase n=1 Tax=Triticum turgidum subsp. durum TaxID=4567 RepID=A0A9R0US35_TRITD|nr:unnamed protein product [Triticum turgidum subsp. durum]